MRRIKQLLLLLLALPAALSATEKIKIAYPNWAEGVAMTHLLKAVLEGELDCEVALTQADPGVIYAALAKGDQDVFVDAWLPYTHEAYWEKYGEELESLGPTFGHGVTGLVVPAYMKIDSIEQLNGQRAALQGKIIGIDAGAGISTNTRKAIAEYGLRFEQVDSSEAAMLAALADAVKKREPIVITGWKPHWMFGRFELKFLEDPRGVYPVDQIRKVARRGFTEAHPEAARLLANFSLTERQLLSLMEALEKGNNPVVAAEEWAERNRPLINSWRMKP